MTQCNQCRKSIDRDKEAFVTIPKSEQCGFRSRKPTSFAHASCFSDGAISAHRISQNNQSERDIEVWEAWLPIWLQSDKSEYASVLDYPLDLEQVLSICKQVIKRFGAQQ